MGDLTFHALPGLVQQRHGAKPAGTLDEARWNAQLSIWLEADAPELFNALHEAGVEAGFIPMLIVFKAAKVDWAAVPNVEIHNFNERMERTL